MTGAADGPDGGEGTSASAIELASFPQRRTKLTIRKFLVFGWNKPQTRTGAACILLYCVETREIVEEEESELESRLEKWECGPQASLSICPPPRGDLWCVS